MPVSLLQVKMEEDFVTAAFFRHAIAQRSDHMRQLEDVALIEEGALPATRAANAALLQRRAISASAALSSPHGAHELPCTS